MRRMGWRNGQSIIPQSGGVGSLIKSPVIITCLGDAFRGGLEREQICIQSCMGSFQRLDCKERNRWPGGAVNRFCLRDEVGYYGDQLLKYLVLGRQGPMLLFTAKH
jgi:hypothetical protein